MFKKSIYLVLALVLITVAYIGLFSRITLSEGVEEAASRPALDPDDPIAFTGHGAIFDLQGNEIEPTVEFLQRAQQYYLSKLALLASTEQRAQLEAKQAVLFTAAGLDERSTLIANAALIDWLIDEIQPAGAAEMRGRNNFIKGLIGNLLPIDSDYPADSASQLEALLQSQGLIQPPTPEYVIQAQRQDYINKCRGAGVPIPPTWGVNGANAWQLTGTLDQTFISEELKTKVFVYKSSNPAGVCMALPRENNNNKYALLGIICLGKVSSNACFWDNQENGVNKPVPVTATKPITEFAGGPELVKGADVCSDCHAGRNPFAIHPNTVLDPYIFTASLTGWTTVDLQLFQPNKKWYTPLVHPDWPQNDGPTDIIDDIPITPYGCTLCHSEAGSLGAGPFPVLSELPNKRGYCAVVLQNAIYGNKSFGNVGTMPPTGYSRHDYSKHTYVLTDACPQNIGPMAESTFTVDTTSALESHTLSYTLVISNSFDVATDVVTATVKLPACEGLASGLPPCATLVPDSVEIDLGSDVTETAHEVTDNTITWIGVLHKKAAQLKIQYEVAVQNWASGFPLNSEVVIEDGLARVRLPALPPPPAPPAPAGPFFFFEMPFIETVEYPDLVVEEISYSGNNLGVVIRNDGVEPISNEFWVDLYLNPDAIPTGVNQVWPTLGDYGAVWGIDGDALPLQPGDSILLELGDGYYWPSLSELPPTILPNSFIYVQTDSANKLTTYGAVLERHEVLGLPYNNIHGILVTSEIILEGAGEVMDESRSQLALPTRPE